MYYKALPRLDVISWLAERAQPFPASAHILVKVAHRLGLDATVIDFLKLFPQHERFATPEDFITRSEELKFLIQEEREAPDEVLRSP